MARGKSDGSVIIDTRMDTSGFRKGIADAKKTVSSISGSLSKLGATIKSTFSQSNVTSGGKGYAELQKEIAKTSAQLDKLIEKQIRFVETGGNIKSRTMSAMEYDIEMTRNRLLQLQQQLAQTSDSAPKKVGVIKTWIDRLRKSFDGLNKTTNRSHYSMLKMLGTSILFSTVFRAISGVTKGFGEGINNLVQYSDEANGTISALKSSLTQLKNSFATAFMPIINIATPLITQFIGLISKATNYVSAFFSSLSGKSTYTKAIEVQENYAESLDKTANSAKKAQGALSSLDELNIISEKDNGTGLLPKDMFKEEEIKNDVLNFAEKVKEVFERENWEGLGAYMSDGIVVGLNTLADKLDRVDWDGIGEKIGVFLEDVEWTKIMAGTGKLIWEGINAGVETWQGAFDKAPIETAIGTSVGSLAITKDVKLSLKLGLISLAIGGATKAGNFLGKTFAEILATALGFDKEKVHGAIWEMENITITQAIEILFSEDFWNGLKDTKDFIDNWFQETFVNNPNKTYSDLNENTQLKMDKLSAIFYVTSVAITQSLQMVIDKIKEFKTQVAGSGIGLGASIGSIGSSAVVSGVKIPMLATGAVIPPNAPFMAVLGDQKHGTNIEAPLDTIKQAVREVMGSSTGGQYQFTAQINRRTLFSEVIEEAKLRQTVTGRNPFDL